MMKKYYIIYIKNSKLNFKNIIINTIDELYKKKELNIKYRLYYNYKEINLTNYIYLIRYDGEFYDLVKKNNIFNELIIYNEINKCDFLNLLNKFKKFNECNNINLLIKLNNKFEKKYINEKKIYLIIQDYNFKNNLDIEFNLLILINDNNDELIIKFSYLNNNINNNEFNKLFENIINFIIPYNINCEKNIIFDDIIYHHYNILYNYYYQPRFLINII